MTPLEPYYQRQLAEAMAGVGRRTDVALLAVLARRADDYAYFPLFWSAVLALALPGLLHGVLGWPSVRGLIVANVLLFVGLCVLLRSPRLERLTVPRAWRRWRASRLATRQFLDLGAQAFTGAGCVMIFVSEAEQYARLLMDKQVALCLDDAVRVALTDRLASQVRQGQTLQGMIECVEACGLLLGQQAPRALACRRLPQPLVILD
ncbi:hypothetical protein JRG49_14130 [Pseudomonas fulva]|jgi:putative membrane protein|uniref:TPM domain-containing protein n=1 Tax=Pseudomonas fulva TaxID=47880 RepID=A0A2L1WAN4_9PSED|nr:MULTISPECIES: membrane protein [Pseudomonas]MDP9663095.1 putative membrane protein [Pseudomonas cremoricolorata]HCL52844.1 hypothetical protein [Pseudomonas sp.]AVF54507.1 hypothetical protein AL527_04580 [Pseudomonas fulva]MBN6791087.1 hypothetical protein [Pseudomonas fulva]MBN6796526.1 hypothetical protein [Pseudomonas fulva]